ncbi:TetR family transcriptional regulator [Nannocystis pusilla]|uniref:TetR family transcriptional regulator n=1 Tax=Nannocystis pusilla TaxID=889268 RepID=UPI003DA496CA
MQPAAKRGRPQEADPRRIARVALGLFERHGFDRVTMGEIAEAASVSRRTLFRLFPSKSDLVWDGLDEVRDVVRQRAASLAGTDLRVAGVLREFAEPFLRRLERPRGGRAGAQAPAPAGGRAGAARPPAAARDRGADSDDDGRPHVVG